VKIIKLQNELSKINIILNNIDKQDNAISNLISFVLTGGKSSNESYHQKRRLEDRREQILCSLRSIQNDIEIDDIQFQLNKLLQSKLITKEEYAEFLDAISSGIISNEKISMMYMALKDEIIDESDNNKILLEATKDVVNIELIRFTSLMIHYVKNSKEIKLKDIFTFETILINNFHIEDKHILQHMFELRKDIDKTKIYDLIDQLYSYFTVSEFQQCMNILDELSKENKLDEYKYRDIRLYIYKKTKKI